MYRKIVTIASLLLAIAVLGCDNKPTAPSKPSAAQPAGSASHGHTHGAGPHGGVLGVWGSEAFHVEFLVDHATKEATVYVLGSDEKSPAPINVASIHLAIDDPKFELDVSAKPLDGEPVGASSRFVGTHESFGTVKDYSGTISAVVDNTPYSADFKEQPN